MHIEQTIKTGGFKYRIKAIVNDDDSMKFDIFDRFMISGDMATEIIISGRIDKFGRCHISDACLDVHASYAMGEIMKGVYEMSYELLA